VGKVDLMQLRKLPEQQWGEILGSGDLTNGELLDVIKAHGGCQEPGTLKILHWAKHKLVGVLTVRPASSLQVSIMNTLTFGPGEDHQSPWRRPRFGNIHTDPCFGPHASLLAH